MFSPPFSRSPTTLAQGALGALRLVRSFLLLEDDGSVGWEVDEDGHTSAAHAHRAPLRRRRTARRPGAPAPARQHCLSPVERGGTLCSRIQVRREQVRGGSVAIGSARAYQRAIPHQAR